MATLTSTISETININGTVRGGSQTLNIAGITQVAEKIMECPAAAGDLTGTTVIGNWASVTNPVGVKYQNYDFNDTEYIRVTNTSNTVTLQVAFVSNGLESQCTAGREGVDSCRFQLKPYQTCIMWDSERGKLGESTVPNFATSLTSLSYIEILNTSTGDTAAAANVELFVASKK
jgi:hypothetical protein